MLGVIGYGLLVRVDHLVRSNLHPGGALKRRGTRWRGQDSKNIRELDGGCSLAVRCGPRPNPRHNLPHHDVHAASLSHHHHHQQRATPREHGGGGEPMSRALAEEKKNTPPSQPFLMYLMPPTYLNALLLLCTCCLLSDVQDKNSPSFPSFTLYLVSTRN